ncbi:MAG TPA: magnesium transporter, partial [Candidatus Limnocylindria bacterium]|nr:magnesium transporter [Candidatus Limnocylindria bacterium]
MTRAAERGERALTQAFLDLYPEEAARLLDASPAAEIAPFLAATSTARAVAVLERLTPERAAQVLERLEDEATRRVLPALDPARAATLLARLDEPARRARLALADEATARELDSLMRYPPDTAGQLMDPRATAFGEDVLARDALARLRAPRQRRVSDVFVVAAGGRLTGVVGLQDLAVARPAERLDALARRDPPRVHALASREDVVEALAHGRLLSLPVVDLENRLLGVIRHDALVDAARHEATADMQTMVGASSEERALSPIAFAVRKRLPWLEINLLTAFLASAVVGLFENTIARFTALAILLPVVAGQSGNTGAQALAVTMRGLALREIRVRHALRVAVKESGVALINGVAVAATTSLGVYVWSRSPGLALVIGLSMVIS